jgi:hypothetical protein
MNLNYVSFTRKSVPVFAINGYRGVKVYFHRFITTSAIDRCEWSISRFGRFTSGEGTFGICGF